MNSQNISFLVCFSTFLCFGEHPLEKMHNKIVHKVPDLTKLINKQKYNTITFELLYKNIYMVSTLKVFILHANIDTKQSKILFDSLITTESALLQSILNTLISILDKPYEQKEQGKKNKPDVIFDLLHLAIGPKPTLLDLVSTLPPESIKFFASLYTRFIESMYTTYMLVKSKNKNSQKNNNYLAKALHYAQQAYKTMQKHQLPLVFDETDKTVDQASLIEWLTQPEQTYTHQLVQKMNSAISKKLVLGIQKINQKTVLPKKLSHYNEFIGDIDFHAEIVTTLFECLSIRKNMIFTPWTSVLKEYIQSINNYLNSMQDNKLVDLLPEANLFRHYKDFLIKTIKNMLEPHADELKNNFQSVPQLFPYISDERIDEIELFIKKWMNKNISFKTETFALQIQTSPEVFDERIENEIILHNLPAKSARSLLLYAKIIANAYKPEIYQWNPLNKSMKTNLIHSGVNIFAFWQKEVAYLYINWLVLQSHQKILLDIEPYLFSYTKESHSKQIKKYAPDKLNFLKETPAQYHSLLFEYGFIEQKPQNLNSSSSSLDIKTVQKSLHLVRKINTQTASVKWHWTFWYLIGNKTVLDIVEGSGITKTINVLDDITNLIFSLPNATFVNQKIVKTIPVIQLKQTVEQLIANMYGLQHALFTYLTSVLYNQKPNPLHQAYIKTGQLLIIAIQKVIDKTVEKWFFLNLKPFKKPIINFNKLDIQYEAQKAFI